MNGNERKELAQSVLDTLPLLFDRLINRNMPKSGPWHIHLLFKLRESPGINMTALSRALNMPKSNLTVVVDKLVSDGIVERTPGESDRRVVSLRLTSRGIEQMETRRRQFIDSVMHGVGVFTDADAGELKRHLDGIARILERYARAEDND